MTAAPSPREPSATARVAAGMIRQAPGALLLLYPLLLVAPMAVSLDTFVSYEEHLSYAVMERLCVLSFLWFLGRRWIRRLRSEPLPHSLDGFLRFLTAGFIFWAMLSVPLLAQLLPLPAPARLVFLLTLIPATLLTLRYYCFFFPLIAGERSLRVALATARTISAGEPALVLKILVSPAAMALLASSLISAADPAGWSTPLTLLSNISSGILEAGVFFLGFAAILTRLPAAAWRAYGLDPYRESRLSTLMIQGGTVLPRILTLRAGLMTLALALLVWSGNTLRLAELPPAAELTVQRILLRNQEVTLELSARDPRYRFRGFKPARFALAGERYTVVSPHPALVTTPEAPGDVRITFPRTTAELALTMVFPVKRSAEDLRTLEDLYLWYGRSRLFRLDLGSAVTPP